MGSLFLQEQKLWLLFVIQLKSHRNEFKKEWRIIKLKAVPQGHQYSPESLNRRGCFNRVSMADRCYLVQSSRRTTSPTDLVPMSCLCTIIDQCCSITHVIHSPRNLGCRSLRFTSRNLLAHSLRLILKKKAPALSCCRATDRYICLPFFFIIL